MNYIYGNSNYYNKIFTTNDNISFVENLKDIPSGSNVYSRINLTQDFKKRNNCVSGKKSKKRFEDIIDLENNEIECMEWEICNSKKEVECLFDKWETEFVISKMNFSGNCKGVFVFTKNRIPNMSYDRYIFCKPVNINDGYVYKIECLYGSKVMSWVSEKDSIKKMNKNIILNIDESISKFKDYENRKICSLPKDLEKKALLFSKEQTDEKNIGYISIDYMKDENGNYICIEYNYTNVAMHWMKSLDSYGDSYRTALINLFENKFNNFP